MEISRGKTDVLKQETGSLVKISYSNIEVAATLIITHVEIRSGWHMNFAEKTSDLVGLL